MIDATAYDPVFLARAKQAEPRLWPNHQRLVRHAHAAASTALAELDDELAVLSVRRRLLLEQLGRYRQRLWPRREKRHVRRPASVDEAAFPPAVVDAVPVVGTDLRQLGVALLRRYGPMSLRELHALIHRHGYVITAERAVQRLGDAMAYETAQGRLVRIGRGRYGPVDRNGESPARSDALPWAVVAGVASSPDPDVRVDPEHWSGSAWPSDRQLGGDLTDGEPDARFAERIGELDDAIRRTRARAAELIGTRARSPRTAPPPSTAAPGPTGSRQATSTRPSILPSARPSAPSAAALGDDSSTNRRQGSKNGRGGGGGRGRAAAGGDGGPEGRRWTGPGSDGDPGSPP